MSPAVEQMLDGTEVRNTLGDSLGDGLVQGACSMAVEQSEQASGGAAEVAAALCDLLEEPLGGRDRAVKAVHPARLARLAFLLHESLDVSLVLDAFAARDGVAKTVDCFAGPAETKRRSQFGHLRGKKRARGDGIVTAAGENARDNQGNAQVLGEPLHRSGVDDGRADPGFLHCTPRNKREGRKAGRPVSRVLSGSEDP